MDNGKYRISGTFLVICIIALIGFKDTGIFVKDFTGLKGDGSPLEFRKEENVKIVKETNESYIVRKNEKDYIIPKENILKTIEVGQDFEITSNAFIKDKPNGNSIRLGAQGEVLKSLGQESGYGYFKAADGIVGYIDLNNVRKIENKSTIYGIAKVNKVIKEDNLVYTLIKGETVLINDFKDELYTVVDGRGNEFSVKEEFIEIRKTRDKTSRGSSLSSRSESISRVVQAGYDALGKPYINAGIGNEGYDCSGLTYAIYLSELDIRLPRISYDQANVGKEVERSGLIPGDLIFFNTSGSSISHVGLYIGDNQMIHASSGQRKVIISDINSNYYKTRYVTSKRIIN